MIGITEDLIIHGVQPGDRSNHINPFCALAAAIVKSAMADYESTMAQLLLEKDTKKLKALYKERVEIESFFKSDWFAELSDLPPEWVIATIRVQAVERAKKGTKCQSRRRKTL